MYFGGGWWWEGMETYPQNFDNFKPQISNRLYLIQQRWESVQSYIGSQYHIMFQKWREEGWLNIYFSRHILEKRFIATPLMIHSCFYHCKLNIVLHVYIFDLCCRSKTSFIKSFPSSITGTCHNLFVLLLFDNHISIFFSIGLVKQ